MNGTPWTEQQLEALYRLYPDFSADVVGRVIGRKPGSVHAKACKLGIEKSATFKASVESGRIQRGRQHPAMVSGQFKPGQQPWNKGTHYQAGGRSAETRFKPGDPNHNTLPIGAYRIAANSVRGWSQLEQKTSDCKGPNHMRWTPVSRLVWEAAHGPVPPKHVIIFKPGCKSTKLEEITPDRLECISRAELVQRNHPRAKHPELAKLVAIKGAITRQVNRIHREHQEQARP
jgi:hypothetical protein